MFFLFMFLLLSLILSVSALPVFPDAEGFGTDTVAGRGGTIYKVTTLAKSGPGSLGECIGATGPRICVFEVSGTIEIPGDLWVSNPYLTIAGQTAPPPGIQLKGGGMWMSGTHDVLIQHLRIRPGDNPIGTNGDNRRSMSMSNRDDKAPYNIVIDHCSLQWGIDINANIWAQDAHDITYSNNIISECLDDSLHSKGAHSKSLNIDHNYGARGNISIIKNLVAHGGDRNPRVGGNAWVEFVNNVMYNVYSYPIKAVDTKENGPHYLSIVGNVGIIGNNSQWGKNYAAVVQSNIADGTRIYADDNMCNNYPDCIRVDRPAGVTFLSNPEVWSGVTVVPTANNEARDYVLANAGARPAEKDVVDARVTQEVRDLTGQIIDCVGPDSIYYPTGTARGGSLNTIIVEANPGTNVYWHTAFWVGKYIEITSGTSSDQIRNITAYDESTQTATVEPAWDTAPDTTSVYRRNMNCSKNAGGWPVYAENYRELTIPDNPNSDDDGDGYTNLEEWLHNFSAVVEGRVVEPPEPPPPEPIPGDLNDDGKVNFQDLIIVASNFGSDNVIADTDNNSIVDIFDVVFVASRFT